MPGEKKKCRNLVRNGTKRAYGNFMKKLFMKKDNRKTFWSFIKSKRKTSHQTGSFISQGQTITDPTVIAESFNSLFASFLQSPQKTAHLSPHRS